MTRPATLDEEYAPEFPPTLEPTEPNPLAESALPEPVNALSAPEPAPIHWAVQDLFTYGDVGLIVGDGGSFKSAAALHIAAAVAGGHKAFDRFETTRAPVLIVSAEDPGSVIQMRLEAFIRGHNWNRFGTLKDIHYFAMAGVQLKQGRWKQHLLDTARSLQVGMIILDPFVDLSGLEEENSNSEASAVMGYARLLARDLHATVLFVHHANKSSEGRTQARIRGAGTIANASRGTLFFEYQDAGVLVEQLKMTYASKLPTFMLNREIQSIEGNRAQWISCRLTTSKPAEARLNKAEEFVLAQVTMSPRELNSSALKRAAKGSGIWAEDVFKATRNLFAKGLIEFEKGPNKQQFWYPTDAGISAQRSQEPAGVNVRRTDSNYRNSQSAESFGGGSGAPEESAGESAVPLRGTGGRQTHHGSAEQGDWQPDETQAGVFDEDAV